MDVPLLLVIQNCFFFQLEIQPEISKDAEMYEYI